MIRTAQFLFAICFTVLLAACAPNPPSTNSNSELATRAELQARQADKNFCGTVFTMAITIVTSRHLLPQTRQELERDMKSEYPGYDYTIASMIDEAYEQKPLSTIGEAANAANQLTKKWINDLAVCKETARQIRA